MVTTLCDNCGARVFPNRACRRDTHDAGCGKLRHDFESLPISVYHYMAGKTAVCCGTCAAAVATLDPDAVRRARMTR